MSKKVKDIETLDVKGLTEKGLALSRELVSFRVSMDPSALSHKGGIAGLRRELREVNRRARILCASKAGK